MGRYVKTTIAARANLKPNGKKCKWCGDGLTGMSRNYCSSKRCSDFAFKERKKLEIIKNI